MPKGTYAKDEFFETMSCEALEKLSGSNQEGRRTFAEQRKVDQETFGGLAGNMNRRGRWGSRSCRGRNRERGRVRNMCWLLIIGLKQIWGGFGKPPPCISTYIPSRQHMESIQKFNHLVCLSA